MWTLGEYTFCRNLCVLHPGDIKYAVYARLHFLEIPQDLAQVLPRVARARNLVSSKLCTLLLARARARQMASGGFAISISGTRNRSEIMESRVLKICMYCTIDYPGICTNNPAFSLLAILANRQQWRQFSRL